MRTPFAHFDSMTFEELQALAVKRGKQIDQARRVAMEFLPHTRDAVEADRLLLIMKTLTDDPSAANDD